MRLWGGRKPQSFTRSDYKTLGFKALHGAPYVVEPLTALLTRPSARSRRSPGKFVPSQRRYKSPNRVEIMFGRLKDWRRVATRYDCCPTAFLSAVALAATVLSWL